MHVSENILEYLHFSVFDKTEMLPFPETSICDTSWPLSSVMVALYIPTSFLEN